MILLNWPLSDASVSNHNRGIICIAAIEEFGGLLCLLLARRFGTGFVARKETGEGL